jgi:parvulin-like peptidyl-prolyl isomerase
MIFRTLRNQMKGIVIVIVVAFGLSLLYMGGQGFFSKGSRRANYVAKVNRQAISLQEFNEACMNNLQFYEMYQGRLSRSDAEEIRFQTLQQMINQKLMLQQVRKNRIKVPKKDIDAEIQRIRDGFPSVDEYKQRLKENKLSEKKLRELLRDNLAIKTLQEKKSKVEITDDDVKQAYEQVRASHILIEPAGPEKDWELAKKQAENILTEIKGGKQSFADMAKKHSADSGSKDQGGDLDFFSRDSGFVKEFVDAAFALTPGEISQPVKTPFGYHLIKVTGRKAAEGPDYEKEKDNLRKRLEEEGASKQFNEWFSQVRAEARIDVTDAALRAQQFVASNQLPQAVAQYQEAIKEDETNAYLHLALGHVYQQLDDPERAIAEFERAVQIGGNDAELYLTLGLAYKSKGRDLDAADQFRKASQIDPWDFRLHLSLLQLFSNMKLEKDVKVEEARLAAIQERLEEQRKAAEAQQKAQEELQRKLAEEQQRKKSEGDQSGRD